MGGAGQRGSLSQRDRRVLQRSPAVASGEDGLTLSRDAVEWEASLLAQCDDSPVGRRVATALRELLACDNELLRVDASERSVTAALVCHLRSEFLGWNVDHEYNRTASDMKRSGGKQVFPDVVIHRRGSGRNLLAVEAKKHCTLRKANEDLRKLRGFMAMPLHYRYALFIQFGVGVRAGVERVVWMTRWGC